jgi:hypothetical protein
MSSLLKCAYPGISLHIPSQMQIGKTNGIFAPPLSPPASTGGRLPPQLAARRWRMGYRRAAGVYRGRGPRDHRVEDAEGGSCHHVRAGSGLANITSRGLATYVQAPTVMAPGAMSLASRYTSVVFTATCTTRKGRTPLHGSPVPRSACRFPGRAPASSHTRDLSLAGGAGRRSCP